MCDTIHTMCKALGPDKGNMGRNPALTPAQITRIKDEFSKAKRGQKYALFMSLAEEFGVHYRTVQNAAYGPRPDQKAGAA